MLASFKQTAPFGFIFGMVFSIVSYLGNLPMDYSLLLILPFITAGLCGLGAIIATYISNYLTSKGYSNNKGIYAISFLAATLVNVFIVLLFLLYFKVEVRSKEIIYSMILGLAMGAGYGLYVYRMGVIYERMKFLQELSEKSRQLQIASRKLAITEERNRMGRDLHDSVAQGLHGIVFSIHSLRNEIKQPPQRIKEILTHMEATADSTLDELRAMIEELKPSLLVEEGLCEAIKITAELFSQRLEIPVEIITEIEDKVPPDLEMAIYRISQESLSNIERHSTANEATIKLTESNGALSLTISDNGKGFNIKESSLGNGLRNMKQRAEEVGGTLDIISKVGLGTSIIAKFPYKG